MFAPNYQTPRSLQMNIGFEKQLGRRGMERRLSEKRRHSYLAGD